LRQTEDDLLNPGWAQRLSEICVTDYLPEKIELVAADFVGVMGRLDQCFDLWKKSAIGRHYASPQAGDRDRDVYPIGICFAPVRMTGMVKVME